MHNAAWYASERVSAVDPEKMGLSAVQARRKVLGAKHPDTLASTGNLVLTYWDQGRWDEAEEREVQVMETTKKVQISEQDRRLADYIPLLRLNLFSLGSRKAAEMRR
jgi:Tetratricopeptide repeat